MNIHDATETAYRNGYEKGKAEVERLEHLRAELSREVDTLKDNNEHLAVMLMEAKAEVVKEVLSDLKKAVHDKAVYPHIPDGYDFVNVKVFDAVLNNVLIKYTEGANGRRKVDKDNN